MIYRSAVILVIAGLAVRAHGQSFRGLGFLPGATQSTAKAVSADGTTVVGTSGSAAGGHAFRWRAPGSAGAGMQDLGTIAGFPYSAAMGVSGDGEVVSGYSNVR